MAIACGRAPLSPSDSSPNKLGERITIQPDINILSRSTSFAGGAVRRTEGAPAQINYEKTASPPIHNVLSTAHHNIRIRNALKPHQILPRLDPHAP